MSIDIQPPPSRRNTIPPGMLHSEQLGERTAQAPPPGIPPWLPWVLEQVPRYLPAVAELAAPTLAAARRSGPWAHIVLLWIAVGVILVGGAMHMVGDGTLRRKIERMDCDVRWLVRREITKDRGETPPPYSPEECYPR